MPLEDTLEALDALVTAGKVRALGVSNFPAWLLAWAIALQDREGWAPFVSLQPQYSLVERSIEIEILPFCRSAGIGVLAWGPLGAGFLSGKYKRGERPPEGSRIADAGESWRRHTSGARTSATSASSTPQARSPRRAARRSRRSRSPGCSVPRASPRRSSARARSSSSRTRSAPTGWSSRPSERARLEEPIGPPQTYPQRMLREQNGIVDWPPLVRAR